jgi:hypothetical protein
MKTLNIPTANEMEMMTDLQLRNLRDDLEIVRRYASAITGNRAWRKKRNPSDLTRKLLSYSDKYLSGRRMAFVARFPAED